MMSKATEASVLILRKAAQLLDKLTDEQITQLIEGKGELGFVTPDEIVTTGRRARAAGSARSARSGKQQQDLTEVAQRLPHCADATEARQYVVSAGLTVDQIKEVAKLLNLTVRGKVKDRLIDNLVENAVGYRGKYEAVLGGPYRP